MTTAFQIRPFEMEDEAAAVALWHDCGLLRPWNDPHKDIARKQTVQPGLFLVAMARGLDGENVLVATAMAGYDGHRGSVYYLAVAPGRQRLAIGRSLMERVEQQLLAMGCPKVHVLVRTANVQVMAFYEKLGYARDDALSLGKRLIPDL
ncbi:MULTISPECIES: GNAT family acetyltransferase [Acidovorax]|uniref:GNAT family acetyltransferase n=1 Tax=Acidovorax TaxID=12916 RepID=UPI002582F2AB|nr:GNAT family acetyltransferase [Acidovorax sp.]